MRNFWILTKLQMLSLFGINKIRHQRAGEEKKKTKRGLWMLIAMAFSLLYVSTQYSVMLCAALQPIGQLSLAPGLMALAASAMTLVFSMFEVKSLLFLFGDYDMVMSWPVSSMAVAASRAVNMYANNLVYDLLLLLPAGVIYALFDTPPVWYYPVMLLGLVLLPAIPSFVGALLGTGVAFVTARLKKAKLWNTIGLFLLMIALMGLMMGLNAGMIRIGEESAAVFQTVLRWYPPADWVRSALEGSGLSLLWLLLGSAAAMILLVLAVGRVFERIHGRLTALPRGKRFLLEGQRRSGLLRALYRQEWKCYMSHSLYVVNTAFGYVMLIAGGVAAAAVKSEAFRSLLDIPMTRQMLLAVPLAMGLPVVMSATTGSAVSIEGKQFWIMRTFPVLAKDYFIGKILVSVTLTLPCVLVAGTLFGFGLKLDAWVWPWLYITPMVCAFFAAVFGLSVNLALPKLDWINEAEVVKQSAACTASIFGGMGIVLLPLIAAAVIGWYWLLPAATLLLLAAALIIWRRLVRRGERKLRAL